MNIQGLQTARQIRDAGRSETIRALARSSITCMAYDAIADMVIVAARAIKPALDEELKVEPPPSFSDAEALVEVRVRRREIVVPFNDLIDDLWSMDRIGEVINKTEALLKTSDLYKHTLRGEIRRDLANDDFVLIVSGLEKIG